MMLIYLLKTSLKVLTVDTLLQWRQAKYNLLKIFVHEDCSLDNPGLPPLSDHALLLCSGWVCRRDLNLHGNIAFLSMLYHLPGKSLFWRGELDSESLPWTFRVRFSLLSLGALGQVGVPGSPSSAVAIFCSCCSPATVTLLKVMTIQQVSPAVLLNGQVFQGFATENFKEL